MKNVSMWALGLLLVASGGVACGGSDEPPPASKPLKPLWSGGKSGAAGSGAAGNGSGGSGTGGNGTAGNATAGSGTAGGGSQAGAGGGGGEATFTKVGSVYVGSTSLVTKPDGSKKAYNSVGASFEDYVPFDPKDCTIEDVGDCQLFACPFGSSTTEPPTTLSAGDLTVTGASVSPLVIKLNGSAMPPSYESSTELPAAPLLVGGETITVEAAGDEVPKFSLQGKAPKPVTLSPYFAAEGASTVSASQDITMKLSGGDVGSFYFLVGSRTTTQQTLLRCEVPVTQPSLVLKASALQKIKSTSAKAFVLNNLSSVTSSVQGEWRFTLSLNGSLLHASGASVPGLQQFTLE